jgi:hypothetical protein
MKTAMLFLYYTGRKIVKKIISLMLLAFVVTGCTKGDLAIDEVKNAGNLPAIQDVQYSSGQGFAVSGGKLNTLDSAKLVQGQSEEPLQVKSSSEGSAILGFVANKALPKGMWSLVVSNAYGQTSTSIYLDVQDGSITDSKIVSMSSIKLSGIVPINLIPSLAASYSVVGHVHSAADVGAVSATVGASDSGKVVKLNNNGLLDSTMIPGTGAPALLYGNDQFYGRIVTGFPCFGFDCDQTENVTVVLSDGAHYISQSASFSYSGYIQNITSESITNYFAATTTPRNFPGVCIYANTSCSGNCGFQNKPVKNALLQRYTSAGQLEWMKASGTETSISFDIVNQASFKRTNGQCTVITSNETNSFIVQLYQFTAGYNLPVSSVPMSNLYLGLSK